MPPVAYTAAVVCPMTGPPLAEGGVLVEGDRITAVGDAASIAARADRVHAVDGVLLPGLVDAATCLELADAGHLARPGPYAAWAAAVEGTTARWPQERWGRSAHRGVLQALRSGTTALGDVVWHGPAVPAASRAGLVGDSWVRVAGVDRDLLDAVLPQVEHALGLPAEGRRVGIAVDPARLSTGAVQAMVALADRVGAPLHAGGTGRSAEVAALRHGEGPLVAEARERGMVYEWLDRGTGRSPVAYLDACGALRPGTSLAGGVWVDLPDARVLAGRGAAVVCSPRASAALQLGELPLERFADAGVPLALGTASPAAAPDADVLAEAAAWVALARSRGLGLWSGAAGPRSLEEQAVRLATVDGARAMGWGAAAGVLEPGRRADLVAVGIPTSPATVYADLVTAGPGRQVLTVLGGVRKARRPSAQVPWPPLDDDAWRAPPSTNGHHPGQAPGHHPGHHPGHDPGHDLGHDHEGGAA